MFRRQALAVIAATGALLLAGCGSDDTADAAADTTVTSRPTSSAASANPTPEASTKPSAAAKDQDAVRGSYVTYDEFQTDSTAYSAGDVVLFFHASWCPKCQETEENLESSGVPDGLTVVKVDFDSSTELRQKYGVTLQHTFVQIDADGNQVAKWSGSYTGDAIASQTV